MTDPEPDYDSMRRAELPTDIRAVADALDLWIHEQHGVTSSHHGAGAFLDILALSGYEITKTPEPDFAALMPPSAD